MGAPPIIIRTAEQEAQDLLAATQDRIADMLGKSIAALPVIVGLGRAPSAEACAAAADKITDMFAGAVLAALEGERTITKLEQRIETMRDALIQADLKIRSYPGADQSDVKFIRKIVDATPPAGAA